MKKTFFHIFRMGVIGLLVALICSSCSVINKLLERDKDYYVHQVKWEGETLSVLAKWYTGNLDNWKAIAQINPAIDPNKIVIGNDIRIPASLLTTREPMPKSFLTGFGSEKKVKPPAPEAPVRPAPAAVSKPDKERPSQAPGEQILPPAIPTAEPAAKPAPADTIEKPALPEKTAPPLKTPTLRPEKKQTPSETGRPAEMLDKPLPAVPSSQTRTESKDPQQKTEQPPEKDEPPLFGPKGYSN
ncbi:MAG: hypothetical protein AB1427_03640 [Thermodesulfobacteriota bacterium]